jgi:Zn-dependent protease
MLSAWWAKSAYDAGGVALVAAWVIWMIASITLHELAHAWAAVGRGDRTPIDAGHMTWNPLVHMGVQSLIMFAILGIAWGATPVDPTRMRGRHAHAWVAFAGPLMNFALAVLCVLAGGVVIAMMTGDQLDRFLDHPFQASANSTSVLPKLAVFTGVGAMLNIALGIFNLVPLPPLDGSAILANFSRAYARFTQSEGGRVASMIAFVAAFFFAGRIIVPVGMFVTMAGMGLVALGLKALGVGH